MTNGVNDMTKMMFPKPKKVKGVKRYFLPRFGKSERKKLIKKIDDLVSKIVRERDKKCIYDPSHSTKWLTCSHFWNRGKMGTRFDLENCDAACWPCHKWRLEKQKNGWYRDFKLKQLGEERYTLLEYRSKNNPHFKEVELQILFEELKKHEKK